MAGVPEITGGLFTAATALTVKLNDGNETLEKPSLTLIVMPLVVPILDFDGDPLNVPLLELNTAHLGLFFMLNFRLLPSGSLAVGVKVY